MTATSPAETFPRQQAATRRFRLGMPRAFRLAPDGTRVAFIRSASGRDAVGNLWIAEVHSGRIIERLVVDARDLVVSGVDLPEAEKARRERMRETTAGITAFSTDEGVTRAVFSLDGRPYAVDLSTDSPVATEVPHPGPVVDPRLAPDGRHAAYVVERALYVTNLTTGSPHCLAQPESDLQSWGLADFIAAEEFDRPRGLWWLSESLLLAELVDESSVEVRWIGDPAQPQNAPIAHRYPSAGTANPVARLFMLSVDGTTRTEVAWDRDAYPYLATVEINDPQTDGSALAVISVLSRDQQRQRILAVNGSDTSVRDLGERVTRPWTTVVSGVPWLTPDGRLLEVVANVDDDCFQLLVDGHPLTPAGMNVSAVVDATVDFVTVLATSDPLNSHVYRVGRDGHVAVLTEGDSVNSAAARGNATVIASTAAARTGVTYVAQLAGATSVIESLAEVPLVTPKVTYRRVGARQLSSAVLLPADHVRGSRRLPVILTPYGGPHHSRVLHAANTFCEDQWLANQGFAVVVIDGAGTPGRGPGWEFAISRDVARVVLDDQVAGLLAVAEQEPDLDLSRVGITGWSFGGSVAALAVLERPDIFRAAVAGAPVTDWALYDTAYSERYLGLPQENPETYAAESLLAKAHRLTRPLLLIHGLADDNVLAANTLQLSSALLAHGKPHSVLPLSGVTHMTPQEVVAENLLRLEVEFLTTHLC